jgi:hypothetical protein
MKLIILVLSFFQVSAAEKKQLEPEIEVRLQEITRIW